MTMTTIWSTVAVLAVAQSPPSPAELGGLLRELARPVKDFELLCEGRIEADAEAGEQGPGTRIFQSSYAHRTKDGASVLDLYLREVGGDGGFERWRLALLEGKVSELITRPDVNVGREIPRVAPGGPGSLHYDGCPERFILLYDLLARGDEYLSSGFESEGWEEIDGRKCMKFSVALPADAASTGRGSVRRYWIDLARGGHVLRFEHRQDGQLWIRKEKIRLEQFPLRDGSPVWFPTHGEAVTFVGPRGPQAEGFARETYDVVRGSLIFNAGLSDARFAIDYEGTRPSGAGFAAMKGAYDASPKAPPPDSPPSDPESIQADLNRRLEEADRQMEMLEATPPSRRFWGAGRWMQFGVAALAASTIITALVLKRRG